MRWKKRTVKGCHSRMLLRLNLLPQSLLVTQLIKARAQQEGCRQACTIGLSINEDTKLRKGKENRWCRGPVQISRGRQGASSKRANGNVAEYGRSFVRSFCHVTPSPPSSTVFRQCRNIYNTLIIFLVIV